jgi:hypothetical protein
VIKQRKSTRLSDFQHLTFSHIRPRKDSTEFSRISQHALAHCATELTQHLVVVAFLNDVLDAGPSSTSIDSSFRLVQKRVGTVRGRGRHVTTGHFSRMNRSTRVGATQIPSSTRSRAHTLAVTFANPQGEPSITSQQTKHHFALAANAPAVPAPGTLRWIGLEDDARRGQFRRQCGHRQLRLRGRDRAPTLQ